MGVFYALSAYFLWGISPIYWKAIKDTPATQLLCHRMVWSFLFMIALLTYKRHWRWLGTTFKTPSIIVKFLISSMLLAANWFTYIWSVNNGLIVEASLGYFMNPLFNVLLGVVFLRERPRKWQWVAIAIAACGVLYLTVGYGVFPTVGIILPLTFGIYALLRKTARLDSIEGVALEMMILFVPAIVYLLKAEMAGAGVFGHTGAGQNLLIAMAGLITAVPLMLFTSGARRITMMTLGLLQYVAPTLQFLLGVLAYGESFTLTRSVGFCIIWTSLLIYTIEGIVNAKKEWNSSPIRSIGSRKGGTNHE